HENFTSWAVRLRPFVGDRESNGMFGRSLSVTWVESGATSQDSAASASAVPSAREGSFPMTCFRSRLYTQIVRPPVVEALARPSKSVGSAMAEIVITPPRRALLEVSTGFATRLEPALLPVPLLPLPPQAARMAAALMPAAPILSK